jgi:hypothetical protein
MVFEGVEGNMQERPVFLYVAECRVLCLLLQDVIKLQTVD